MAQEYERSIERLERQAKIEGLELRIANFNELFIDLDDFGSKDLTEYLRSVLQPVHKFFGPIVEIWARRSKGGNGWHVRVVMAERIDPKTRCILHLAVGSDRIRELLRTRAIEAMTEDQPSVFLDKPENLETQIHIGFIPSDAHPASMIRKQIAARKVNGTTGNTTTSATSSNSSTSEPAAQT